MGAQWSVMEKCAKMELLKSIVLSSSAMVLWQNKLEGEHSGQFLKSLNNAQLKYFNN